MVGTMIKRPGGHVFFVIFPCVHSKYDLHPEIISGNFPVSVIELEHGGWSEIIQYMKRYNNCFVSRSIIDIIYEFV